MHCPGEMLLAILLVSPIVNSTRNASAVLEKKRLYQCVANMGCQLRVQRSQFMDHHSGHYRSVKMCHRLCRNHVIIWPVPFNTTFGQKPVRINPNFLRFIVQNVPQNVKALLKKMIHVAVQNLQAECKSGIDSASTPVIFHFFIETAYSSLFWNINESYSLSVNQDRKIHVEVRAHTVFGARHALETFIQLVTPGVPKTTANDNCTLNLLVGTKISDAPTYTHRGLMLDTARHFIPIENIKKMIEGMGATKMNVFHWHVTDTQSFPLQSASVPQLTKYGAYSPIEIYKTEQVRALVDFALVHGVRVVIEIDSPGHAGNGWQWGKEEHLGDLAVCVNAKPWRNYCLEPPCGQLNPLNPNTYEVLDKLFGDIFYMLSNPVLLHLGGDEINFNCWNSSRQIQALMIKRGLDLSKKSFFTIWAEFYKKVLEICGKMVKRTPNVMIWSSELTTPYHLSQYQFLDKNRYVIEVWKKSGNSLLRQLLDLGYRIVSAPVDVWYLDRNTHWVKMYSHVLPSDKNVLGGEVAVWTEHIVSMKLDAATWPRAAAVAERLWSNPKTNAELAKPRLEILRQRLIYRGLRPDMESL